MSIEIGARRVVPPHQRAQFLAEAEALAELGFGRSRQDVILAGFYRF